MTSFPAQSAIIASLVQLMHSNAILTASNHDIVNFDFFVNVHFYLNLDSMKTYFENYIERACLV